ncbi:MAG: hypothetical protein V1904_01065 [Bacteroidota bacterium]
MLIVADKKIPDEAKNNLRKFGELVLLETKGITEESISGHPDIFICCANEKIIVAPNIPAEVKKILAKKNIPYIEGGKHVGIDYPEAAHYNAVVINKAIIHRIDITDKRILETCKNYKLIEVAQGFTRCSLLPVDSRHFITSDEGIHKTLIELGYTVLKVSVNGIILKGHPHGFFGGACGVTENKIFILGNLNHYRDKKKVDLFVGLMNFEIVELYDGPLFDGGGIFFLKN